MFFCSNTCNEVNEEGEIIYYTGGSSNISEARISVPSVFSQHMTMIKQSHQSYTKVRQSAKYKKFQQECMRSGKHFIDPYFPHNDKSLNFVVPGRKIIWKRLPEVIRNCCMIEGGINPCDILQGDVGDCYFLAAVSALAENEERIRIIFQNNMCMSETGLYKLTVNHEGQLRQVFIDDYVPVFAESNRPVFCKPNNGEIWVMLMEKVWAKLKGSYGNMSSGCPHEVLNTFSCAPCLYYELHPSISEDQKDSIWNQLMEAENLNFAVCCGSKSMTAQGIKPSHTYTLLASYVVTVKNKKYKVIKLRNPWGNTEYTGPCSETDNKFWDEVHPTIRLAIFQKQNENDGIFTIPFEEFLRNFESLDILHNRENFYSDYLNLKISKNEPTFVELTVKSESEVYLSFERKCDLDLKKQMNNGYTKILLARKFDEETYQYIDSGLETNFEDITLRCLKLTPGNYVALIQSDIPKFYQSFDAYFSTYSQQQIQILKKNQPILNFMSMVFKNHAFRINKQKISMGPTNKDWIAQTLLYQKGGYGYIACSLSPAVNIKIILSLDRQKISKGGYILEEKSNQFQSMIVEPGGQEILVFSINLGHSNQGNLEFPPPGVKISRII